MDLENYENREHAKAKHLLLKSYIQRYAMILGRNATEIAFIDGFAGPWQSGADDRSDTSFGLSAATLKGCAETLRSQFTRQPKIRALWIEEDVIAYDELSKFAVAASSSRIAIQTKQAAFQDSIDDVIEFIGDQAYSFTFIDPKGYKNLIEPDVLAPLLQITRAELLINYMWGHIKYAFGHLKEAGHRENLNRLYGPEVDRLARISDGAQLEEEALRVYEKRLRDVVERAGKGKLRVLSYPILDTRGNRYPKYWLVHVTHSAKGMVVFADECEKAHKTQDAIFYVANINRRESRTGTTDLFADHADSHSPDNSKLLPTTDVWLELLPNNGDMVTVDTEKWADLLEQGRCLPTNLQEGFKQLRDVGLLENMDAKGVRRTRFVHPESSEKIRRLK